MPMLKRGSRRGAGRRLGAQGVSRRRSASTRRTVPSRRAPAATVLLHPGLLRRIAGAVTRAGDLETGGPLIGTVQRSWPAGAQSPRLIVSLLGTVPPGPALRATECSVSLGRRADGERAASAIRWWRAVTGLELFHLGDWHKHDSHSPEPSAGDRATAERMREEGAAPLWLAAIAVGERSVKSETSAADNLARVTSAAGEVEQVRFYRAFAGAGLKPVPVRVEAHALPGLPKLPWHVADPARFAAECRLLAAAGLRVAIEPSDSRTRPGVKLGLRRDGKPPLTVITGPDYPAEPPLVHDGDGKRLKASGPWSANRFLVDLVAGDR
jgi:hypothetical protein